MFILKGKRWLYHSAIMFLLIISMVVVISGLNLTAKRMATLVPQLPDYAIRAEKAIDEVSIDILGWQFQVRLPGFLANISGVVGGEEKDSPSHGE